MNPPQAAQAAVGAQAAAVTVSKEAAAAEEAEEAGCPEAMPTSRSVTDGMPTKRQRSSTAVLTDGACSPAIGTEDVIGVESSTGSVDQPMCTVPKDTLAAAETLLAFTTIASR